MSFVKEKSIQIPKTLFYQILGILQDVQDNSDVAGDFGASVSDALDQLAQKQNRIEDLANRALIPRSSKSDKETSQFPYLKQQRKRDNVRRSGWNREPDPSLIGAKFGNLTIQEYLPSENGFRIVLCKCDCGNEIKAKLSFVKSGNTKSCGCLRRRRTDLTGKRFFMLTVQSLSEKRDKYKNAFWVCLCDCGKTTLVRTTSLNNGSVKSCGCARTKKNESKPKEMPLSNRALDGAYLPALARKTGKHNTSGHKGVSLVKRSQKWIAYIQLKGRRYDLGLFANKEDAIAAREKAEAELHSSYLDESTTSASATAMS